MEKTELLEKINSFPYWHYPFSLRDGVVIHPTNKENAREKIELRDFIWPVVMAVNGGSLKGLRVLDVGCNEGFWSLEAHKSGAAYVLGVDARAQHVEQAQLVRDALGIDPSHLEYRQMDVNDLSREQLGEFDLCLFLRVLQHLPHPLLGLQKLREMCRGHLVMDVKLVRMEWPVLFLMEEWPEGLLEGTNRMALRPSRSAVELMLKSCGFTDVQVKPPRRPLDHSYFVGKRAVFTARACAEGERADLSYQLRE